MRKKNEKEREKKEKNRWKKGPRLHVRGLHQIKKSAGIFPIERSIGFQFWCFVKIEYIFREFKTD